nr:hypothetical protein [Tanacetum cinerariifolium]
IEAIMLFLAYAPFVGFIVHQMDVKSAFLYGIIEEEVFRRGIIDKTLFIKKDKGGILLEQVYVDDIIFGFTKRVGGHVERGWNIISHEKYVADILKKFKFSLVKTTRTPIGTNKALLKDEEVVVTPKVSHLHAVKRIFIYLKCQPKLGLWYPRDSPFDLEYFSDSDYAGASLDGKSITGGCQFLDGKKIIITKASIRRNFQLQDVECTACLPNDTVFEELAGMGYDKITQQLTFYKAFFSPQWKYLIHTILQCLCAKTVAWNEFSITMAYSITCLANNQKFNFSKYIFDNMVKYLEAGVKFFMFSRFVQVFVDHQLGDMSQHKKIFVTPSLTKKKKQKSRRTQGKETEVPHTEPQTEESVPTPFNYPLPSEESQEAKEEEKVKDFKFKKIKEGRINEEEMFEVNDLDGDEVIVDATAGEEVKQSIKVAEKEVSVVDPVTTFGEVATTAEDVEVTTAATTSQISKDELTLAQTLI